MPTPPNASGLPEAPKSDKLADNQVKQMPPHPAEANSVVKPVLPRNIKVKALSNGWAENERKKEGDTFVVAKFAALGSWMQCEDPLVEKMHQESMRAKKLKANTAED